MPILDSVRNYYKSLKVSPENQERITDRLIENFPSLQHNYTLISGDAEPSGTIKLILRELINKANRELVRREKQSFRDTLALFTTGQRFSSVAQTCVSKLKKSGFRLLTLSEGIGSDIKVKKIRLHKTPSDVLAMIDEVFDYHDIDCLYLSASPGQEAFHASIELLYACQQIINPGVKVILCPVPGENVKYYADRSWHHNRECDGLVNELYTSSCWDAIATQHTNILYPTLERCRDQAEHYLFLNAYDKLYLSFNLFEEDIWAAGYSPEPHMKFLRDYYTFNFPGTMSSLKLIYRDGRDVFKGSIQDLAGLTKSRERGLRKDSATAMKRILMLEALTLTTEGIPLLGDYPADRTLNRKLWDLRMKILSILGTPDTKDELIPPPDNQVFIRKVTVKNDEYLLIINFRNDKSRVGLESLQPHISVADKDLLGNRIHIRNGNILLDAYDLLLL